MWGQRPGGDEGTEGGTAGGQRWGEVVGDEGAEVRGRLVGWGLGVQVGCGGRGVRAWVG